jgi:hypothetical protein
MAPFPPSPFPRKGVTVARCARRLRGALGEHTRGLRLQRVTPRLGAARRQDSDVTVDGQEA